MVEIFARLALLLVIAMLIFAVWRQFNLLGSRGQIADRFAILPQWKFFAQSIIAVREDNFDDRHLLVRLADDKREEGLWQSVFWNDERKWVHILWNPYLRARGEIETCMIDIVNSGDAAQAEGYQTSLSYLTILRHCLDQVPLSDGNSIRFAIVTTRGRGVRPVAVRYLSAWHTV